MRMPAANAKQSKYRNQKVRGYDSKREAKRADALAWLEKAGEIRDLRQQVRYELLPKQDGERAVNYVADFVYVTKEGQQVVEDTKGYRTADYILKRKLMLFRHGIRLLET